MTCVRCVHFLFNQAINLFVMTIGASDFLFIKFKNTSQHFPTPLRFLSYRWCGYFIQSWVKCFNICKKPQKCGIYATGKETSFSLISAVCAQYCFPRSLNLGPPVIATRMTFIHVQHMSLRERKMWNMQSGCTTLEWVREKKNRKHNEIFTRGGKHESS